MDLPEINARQNELDRLSDYFAETDVEAYGLVSSYLHERGIELDAMRPGDAEEE